MNCADIKLCSLTYYSLHNTFLQETEMWSYAQLHTAFALMLFTHDVWFVFTVIALWEFIEELSVAVAGWTGQNWILLKSEWDAADTLFDISIGIFGIMTAVMVIWILRPPKLIRYPYLEARYLEQEYKTTIKLNYPRKQFMLLRWKYWIQIASIQWLPSIVFFFWSPPPRDGAISTRLARLDWCLFTGITLLLILFLFLMNYTSKIERDHLWNKNRLHYRNFYAIWAAVFLLFTLPGIYMFLYPKEMILIGVTAVYVILFPVVIYSTFSRGDIPRVMSLIGRRRVN